MRAVSRVMYSGIIRNAQNHRLERARFVHSFLMPLRCNIENGAWEAMKRISSTTMPRFGERLIPIAARWLDRFGSLRGLRASKRQSLQR